MIPDGKFIHCGDSSKYTDFGTTAHCAQAPSGSRFEPYLTTCPRYLGEHGFTRRFNLKRLASKLHLDALQVKAPARAVRGQHADY